MLDNRSVSKISIKDRCIYMSALWSWNVGGHSRGYLRGVYGIGLECVVTLHEVSELPVVGLM